METGATSPAAVPVARSRGIPVRGKPGWRGTVRSGDERRWEDPELGPVRAWVGDVHAHVRLGPPGGDCRDPLLVAVGACGFPHHPYLDNDWLCRVGDRVAVGR